MKLMHRSDMWCWSRFDEERDMDFNSYVWIRPEGNVVFDPLPLSDHDHRHLERLGGAKYVLLTNSDHVRATQDLRTHFRVSIAGPAAERENFPIACDRWLSEGDKPLPGLRCFELEGSKTPGELAYLIEETTLITGDLVRAKAAGTLALLPEEKLTDGESARSSLKRVLESSRVEAVLVGDGWPLIRDGYAALKRLVS